MAGGYGNSFTGAGGRSRTKPSIRSSLQPESTAVNHSKLSIGRSWAAKKLITIPVEDMLIRWREFSGERRRYRRGDDEGRGRAASRATATDEGHDCRAVVSGRRFCASCPRKPRWKVHSCRNRFARAISKRCGWSTATAPTYPSET